MKFRELASALTAFIVVISYILVGFLQMLSAPLFGTAVEMPESWNAAMLGLASAALGYLIGKSDQTDEKAQLAQARSEITRLKETQAS